MAKKRILIVMGVSGSGKSTLAKKLAQNLRLPFIEGDEHHSEANVKKMQTGTPLDDTDRMPWLQKLNALLRNHADTGAVLTCSALKASYRDVLTQGIESASIFIYLKGSFNEIMERLEKRTGHFMPAALLKSQFETLEQPEEALEVSIDQKPEEILKIVLRALPEYD